MPSAAFNAAAEEVKNLTKKPADAEMLEIYSLFKQCTVGDCNIARPGMLDMQGRPRFCCVQDYSMPHDHVAEWT